MPDAKGHPQITLPPGHLVGMRVPDGGSDCAKCKFVRGQDCSNALFVKWNNGQHKIPGDINAYCCDFFEIGRMAGAFSRKESDSEYA
jgi:hypothetical protein